MKTIADRASEQGEYRAGDIRCLLIGSPAKLMAANWNTDVSWNCGFPVTRKEVSCPDWIAEIAILQLNGEYIRTAADIFSPPCDFSERIESVCPPAKPDIFYSNGAPGVAETNTRVRNIYHTMSDTIEWMRCGRLAESARLGLDLLEIIDQKDRSWSRPKN